jgi:hypothetical protein
MRKWTFSLVAALILSSQVGTGTVSNSFRNLCKGILPENNLSIPEGAVHVSKITKAQFDFVLNRLTKLYTNEIANKGGHFVIERLWSDGTVNAYADRSGSDWVIHMYGGMARHPALTSDGFALVACHELGHHLGGAPRFVADDGNGYDWASVEGEADYYATLKCLRRYFEQDDNGKILAGMNVDKAAVTTCRSEHGGKQDQDICIRATMAGISMAGVLANLEGTSVPKLTTPDRKKVSVTDPDHPAGQCRLDTYYNGALCRVPVAQALSDNDYHPGSCADANTYAHGLRSRCWFAP